MAAAVTQAEEAAARLQLFEFAWKNRGMMDSATRLAAGCATAESFSEALRTSDGARVLASAARAGDMRLLRLALEKQGVEEAPLQRGRRLDLERALRGAVLGLQSRCLVTLLQDPAAEGTLSPSCLQGLLQTLLAALRREQGEMGWDAEARTQDEVSACVRTLLPRVQGALRHGHDTVFAPLLRQLLAACVLQGAGGAVRLLLGERATLCLHEHWETDVLLRVDALINRKQPALLLRAVTSSAALMEALGDLRVLGSSGSSGSGSVLTVPLQVLQRGEKWARKTSWAERSDARGALLGLVLRCAASTAPSSVEPLRRLLQVLLNEAGLPLHRAKQGGEAAVVRLWCEGTPLAPLLRCAEGGHGLLALFKALMSPTGALCPLLFEAVEEGWGAPPTRTELEHLVEEALAREPRGYTETVRRLLRSGALCTPDMLSLLGKWARGAGCTAATLGEVLAKLQHTCKAAFTVPGRECGIRARATALLQDVCEGPPSLRSPEVFTCLLTMGAQVDARYNEGDGPRAGFTPLMALVRQKQLREEEVEVHLQCVRALVAGGADVNATAPNGGGSVLMCAVGGSMSDGRSTEVLEDLLAAGAQPGHVDGHKRTLLHVLMQCGGLDARLLPGGRLLRLVQACLPSCSPHLANTWGSTPLDCALHSPRLRHPTGVGHGAAPGGQLWQMQEGTTQWLPILRAMMAHPDTDAGACLDKVLYTLAEFVPEERQQHPSAHALLGVFVRPRVAQLGGACCPPAPLLGVSGPLLGEAPAPLLGAAPAPLLGVAGPPDFVLVSTTQPKSRGVVVTTEPNSSMLRDYLERVGQASPQGAALLRGALATGMGSEEAVRAVAASLRGHPHLREGLNALLSTGRIETTQGRDPTMALLLMVASAPPSARYPLLSEASRVWDFSAPSPVTGVDGVTALLRHALPDRKLFMVLFALLQQVLRNRGTWHAACVRRDAGGRTLLHRAADAGAPPLVVQALVTSEATHSVDMLGRHPCDVASTQRLRQLCLPYEEEEEEVEVEEVEDGDDYSPKRARLK